MRWFETSYTKHFFTNTKTKVVSPFYLFGNSGKRQANRTKYLDIHSVKTLIKNDESVTVSSSDFSEQTLPAFDDLPSSACFPMFQIHLVFRQILIEATALFPG